jgi:sec-independent protein translocase protein TatC
MITPDPTLISDIVLGLPFIVLYFFTMWLVKRSEKGKKKD